MKYTTKQSDGTYRTVDTQNDGLLSLVSEMILDWNGSKKKTKKKVKTTKTVQSQKLPFNLWIFLLLLVFFWPAALIYLIVKVTTNGRKKR